MVYGPADPPPVDWAAVQRGVLDLIRTESTPVVSFEHLAETIVVYVQAQLHPAPRRDDDPVA